MSIEMVNIFIEKDETISKSAYWEKFVVAVEFYMILRDKMKNDSQKAR